MVDKGVGCPETGLPWNHLPKETLVATLPERWRIVAHRPMPEGCPPMPTPTRSAAPVTGAEALGPIFLSAEDFDATGILAGVEPCASNYWWIPELHNGMPSGGVPADLAVVSAGVISQTAVTNRPAAPPLAHAARRTSRRSTAA